MHDRVDQLHHVLGDLCAMPEAHVQLADHRRPGTELPDGLGNLVDLPVGQHQHAVDVVQIFPRRTIPTRGDDEVLRRIPPQRQEDVVIGPPGDVDDDQHSQ